MDTWRRDSDQQAYRLFEFTDRPIYRPGNVVHFKGVLRAREGAGYCLPAPTPVAFVVTDGDGTEVYRAHYTTNAQGSFAGSFTLPPEAKAGAYTMTSTIGNFKDETDLTVASYLKPEVQLSARARPAAVPARGNGDRGDSGCLLLRRAGRRARSSLDAEPISLLPSRDDEEQYGDEGDSSDEEAGYEEVHEGEGKTDENGRLVLNLPSTLPTGARAEEENPYSDHKFFLHVWSTSDVGGEAMADTSYLVTRGQFDLSLTPENYVLTPNQAGGLKVTATDFAGHPVPNQEVELSLISESRPPGNRPGPVTRSVLSRWSTAHRTGRGRHHHRDRPQGGRFRPGSSRLGRGPASHHHAGVRVGGPAANSLSSGRVGPTESPSSRIRSSIGSETACASW